ncbi:MAG: hemin receptor, partial [Prevotella sp.]
SWGSYYASQTDFVNWKATNRITFGLGYYLGKFNVDLAYQYSAQSGDFYPFTSYFAASNEPAEMNNICNAAKVDNKRHRVLLTLGYKF